MIFDDDGFEYDPCWNCSFWRPGYGCCCCGWCPYPDPVEADLLG